MRAPRRGASTCNRGPFAAQPLGLLDAGHARRRGLCREARLTSSSITSAARRPIPNARLTSGDPRAEGRLPADPERNQVHLRLRHADPQVADRLAVVQLRGPDGGGGSLSEPHAALANCPARPATLVGADHRGAELLGRQEPRQPQPSRSRRLRQLRVVGLSKVQFRAPLCDPDVHARRMVSGRFGNALLSSDAMVPNAVPGTTFHADYFEGWDPTRESDVDRQLHQQDARIARRAISATAGSSRARRSEADGARRLMPRFDELQRVLVGVALDRLVEDRLGVVVGTGVEETCLRRPA